jgi:predicted GIY-YIG superfamily endonuclease
MTDWYCYILRSIDKGHENLTYNGSTNDLKRRLRQHNQEISGGAKATRGHQWEIYAYMTGFTTHSNALSCEWRIKHPTNQKRRPPQYCGVIGRIKGLNIVLPLEKWTGPCEILNNECEYTLHIKQEFVEYLDLENIPENIQIVPVDKIDVF